LAGDGRGSHEAGQRATHDTSYAPPMMINIDFPDIEIVGRRESIDQILPNTAGTLAVASIPVTQSSGSHDRRYQESKNPSRIELSRAEIYNYLLYFDNYRL
jgi:hypothetical protein